MILLPLLSTVAAQAHEPEPLPPPQGVRVYGEFATLLFVGHVGGRVEYRYGPIAGSVGVGAGYIAGPWNSVVTGGVAPQVHLITSRTHSFELALGLGLIAGDTVSGTQPFPSGFIGYRFEQPNGKLLLRMGASTAYLGIGLNVSAGVHF